MIISRDGKESPLQPLVARLTLENRLRLLYFCCLLPCFVTPSLTLPTNYRLFCKFTQEFYFFRGTKANNPVWARWARLACPRALPAIKIFSCSDLMRYNFFSAFKTSYSLMGMGRMGVQFTG